MLFRSTTVFIFILALCTLAPGQNPSGVVINEVFTGSPDWIEIRNFSNATKDLSGWKIEATFASTTYPSFTFPAGTILYPGQIILVIENSNPTPFFTPPPYDVQVLNTQFGYGWIGTSTGAVALVDANAALQDLVVFGASSLQLPPSAVNATFLNPVTRAGSSAMTGNVVYRKTMVDNDDGGDWHWSNNGTETPGLPNPGQLSGPQPVVALIFDPSGGLLAIDPNTSAIHISANITGVILADGREMTDPAWDVVIGGSVVLNGHTPVTALADLKNSIWIPTFGAITAANGEVLSLQGAFLADAQKRFIFAGDFGCEPRGRRSMGSLGVNSVLSGLTSPALTQLWQFVQSSKLHFQMRFDPAGARLIAVSMYDPPTPSLTSKLSNSGSGSLQVGVLGATQPEIYNVFIVNPAYTLGTGPIFGVTWEPFQWQQVWTPLGTTPYHVSPTTGGTYFFQSPPGVIPPGVWLDHITIEVVNQVPKASAPTRAFF